MDVIEELKQTKIWQHLYSINQDYADRAVKFAQHISPILNTISIFFPFYTSHKSDHSLNILRKYPFILKAKCFTKNNKAYLNDVESYLLICSAFAHDVGMAVFPKEEEALLAELKISKEDGWETNKRLQDFLRANHSKRGFEYLTAYQEQLSIPVNLLDLLDKMMVAHNQHPQDLKTSIVFNKYSAADVTFPLEQLASILCIADALEFSDTRVKESVISQLKEKIKVEVDDSLILSYYENVKNACIGRNITVDRNGQIIVSGSFREPEVLNLAHKTFDDIECWIRDYIDIDSLFLTPRLSIRNHIIFRNLRYLHGEFQQLGIRLRKEYVIKLVTSPAIWRNNPAGVIKELLQNSVEACRYRRFNSSSADNYMPQILVDIDSVNNIIAVSDNGCGMSKNIVLDHFLTVGNSRSNNPLYRRGNFESLSRFGIGFWSVFSIASKAEINTSNFENTNCDGIMFEVTLDPIKNYIVFRPGMKTPGTSIRLFLQENINLGELQANLAHQILCSEIQVKVKIKNSVGVTEHLIPNQPMLPSKKDIFGGKLSVAEQFNIQVFYWEETNELYDFRMYITYKQEEERISFFLTESGEDIYFTNWANRQIKSIFKANFGVHETAICGFSINPIYAYIVFNLEVVGGYLANIKNPAKHQFSLNRMTLQPSADLEEYSQALSTFFLTGYRKFLEHTNSLETSEIYRLNIESGRGLGSNETNKIHEKSAIEKFPELFCYKLFKVSKNSTLKTCEVKYFNLMTLLNMDIKVVFLDRTISRHNYLGFDHRNVHLLYDLVKDIDEFEGGYFVDFVTREVSMLFEKSPTSYIRNEKKYFPQFNEIYSFPWFVFNPSTIELEANYFDRFGTVNTHTWGGSIYYKDVLGHPFVFSSNRIIINPLTDLAAYVKEMYALGSVSELAETIQLLEILETGVVDDRVRQFIR